MSNSDADRILAEINSGATEIIFFDNKNDTLLYFTKITYKCKYIRDEGAKVLAEALKINRTLTSINLNYIKLNHFFSLLSTFFSTHILNEIGDDGARAIAESLKINRTLVNINLD